MKKTVCFLALCFALALTGTAMAQDAHIVSRALVGQHGNNNVPPGGPSYCKPCLFYGGDWDPNSTDWVAFGNANDPVSSDVYQVYSPFIVKGTWKVSGLFTNDITTGASSIDPQTATWSINTGVASGSGGKVKASGDTAATFNATGRNYSGIYYEYTTLTKKLGKTVKLTGKGKKGTMYWETVQPDCTNSSDPVCADNYYYETDNETNLNHVGTPEPIQLSYQNGGGGAYNYVNTCSEGYNPPGCQAMSAGVLGKK